ncbi:MAG: hypothetical protein JSS27_02705 [Planctomycetes bacterium]|nr:hypothetical protein [Planctomycetota bacterium]
MTLIICQPRELDELTLRLLDAAAQMRAVSRLAQEKRLTSLKLHRGKLEEWLTQIELWLHRAEGQVNTAVHEQRGAELAERSATTTAPRAKPRRS